MPDDVTAYRRLALAVLDLAVKDSRAGAPEAERFLANGNAMLAMWCAWLGLTPQTLMRLARTESWEECVRHARESLAEPSPQS